MVTRNEMKKFKRQLKVAAVAVIGVAVLCGGIYFALGDDGEKPADNGGGTPGQSQGQEGTTGDAVNSGDAGEPDKPQQNQEFLLLVNKTHPIDENYKPDDLTPIQYFASDRDAASRFMRKEPAEQFHKLVEAAKEEGHEIVMTTAYRSYGFQSVLYNNYVQQHGEAEANKFSAKPGQSEHQTGLCTDVASPSVNYQLTTDYGDAPEGKWLAEHAHEFGFIIRFPLGKEEVTGYQYEPWHIRYVGQPAADEIYEQGITLEEYLETLS